MDSYLSFDLVVKIQIQKCQIIYFSKKSPEVIKIKINLRKLRIKKVRQIELCYMKS